MRRHFSANVPRDEDLLPRWFLLAVIMVLLLTGIYTLVYHAAQRSAAARELAARLPRDYPATLQAMIASTGNACERVCGVYPLSTAPGTSAVSVMCGHVSANAKCENGRHYVVSIAPAPEPSR
ncbi:MAG: hypothetical protein ABL973_15470 [Micropepsaceae bacterium]